MIVTDIVNSGTYAVRNGTVRVHLTHPGDMPTDFELYLDVDGSSLISFFGGARREWLLKAP